MPVVLVVKGCSFCMRLEILLVKAWLRKLFISVIHLRLPGYFLGFFQKLRLVIVSHPHAWLLFFFRIFSTRICQQDIQNLVSFIRSVFHLLYISFWQHLHGPAWTLLNQTFWFRFIFCSIRWPRGHFLRRLLARLFGLSWCHWRLASANRFRLSLFGFLHLTNT